MQRSSIDFTSENIKFIQVNYFIDGLLIISNSYIIQRKKIIEKNLIENDIKIWINHNLKGLNMKKNIVSIKIIVFCIDLPPVICCEPFNCLIDYTGHVYHEIINNQRLIE